MRRSGTRLPRAGGNRAVAALVLASTLAAGLPAGAQPAGPEQVRESEQRVQEQIQANEAAARAAMQDALSGGGEEVSWEQVRQHPDDPAINAAWARQQIRRGNLLGAATALERLLLLHPEAAEIRLVHALVLLRLDDKVTAQSELEAIDPAQLSPDLRRERTQALEELDRRTKRLHQSVTLTLGGHYDDNRNASPTSGNILINDLSFTLEGSAQKRSDWGKLAQTAYDFDYDLGTDPRLSLYGSLAVMGDRQSALQVYNTVSGGATGGLRYTDGPVKAQVGLIWASMAMNDDYYLSDYGVTGNLSYRLAEGWEAISSLRVEKQVFHDIYADRTATDSSGILATMWGGVQWHPTPAHTVALSLGASRRNAATEYMSNTRRAVRLGDTWLLGAGQFVALTGELGAAAYHAPNPTFSTQPRRDNDSRVTLTYGVPLGTVAGLFGVEAPEQVSDMVASVSAEHYHMQSTLTNYTYTNIRTQALLSKRWEF
ncbi:MAG: hypothetical protein RLZZ501_1925 [Pseudomonadota bacterium]